VETGTALNRLERDAKVTQAAPALPLQPATPAYTVTKLYRDHFASDILQLGGDMAMIDAIATGTPDGRRICVKLVNPKPAAASVEIALRGDFPLLGTDLQVVSNGRVVNGAVRRSGLTVGFDVPPESVAVLTLTR
jgi:hypothetical protein